MLKLLLRMLLLLHVLSCQCIFYYDDDEWKEEDINDEKEIDYDRTDVSMLIANGYRPQSHNGSKFMVSIQTRSGWKFFGDNHYCSGALVGLRTVVTAAHCVVDLNMIRKRPRRVRVVLGTPNRLHKTKDTVKIPVESIKVPRLFARGLTDDIAVLGLRDSVPLRNAHIALIGLAVNPPKVHTKCVTMGWGQLLNMGPYAAEAVYADLEIVNHSVCENHKYFSPDYSRKQNLCALSPNQRGISPCRGDSGAPLVCDGELAGIAVKVSCASESPIVYTNVFYHTHWIYDNLLGDAYRLKPILFLVMKPFVLSILFTRVWARNGLK